MAVIGSVVIGSMNDSVIVWAGVLTFLVGTLTLVTAVATWVVNVKAAEMTAESIADFKAVIDGAKVFITCENVAATLYHASILEEGSTMVSREESIASPQLAGSFPLRLEAGDMIELSIPQRWQENFSCGTPPPIGLMVSHSRRQKKKPLCRVVAPANKGGAA
jgi:hypothetical protein